MTPEQQGQFGENLRQLLNRYSAENDSNTPDFVLTAYLIACLNAFNHSVNSRNRLRRDGSHLHTTEVEKQ